MQRTSFHHGNTGDVSAQAGFTLRLAGMDNARLLQTGFVGWQARDGFAAHRRAGKGAEWKI